jgi:hypothetical protein
VNGGNASDVPVVEAASAAPAVSPPTQVVT